METLTAAMIATLLLTKMVEKLGEMAGEKLPELGGNVLEQMKKLKELLWRNAPTIAGDIERVINVPEIVEQEPQNYGIPVLVEKMELAAKDDEIAKIIEALATEVRPQLSSKVVQTIATGIISQEGGLTVEKIKQDGNGSNDVTQVVGDNVTAKKDIIFSDITQTR